MLNMLCSNENEHIKRIMQTKLLSSYIYQCTEQAYTFYSCLKWANSKARPLQARPRVDQSCSCSGAGGATKPKPVLAARARSAQHNKSDAHAVVDDARAHNLNLVKGLSFSDIYHFFDRIRNSESE